MSTLKVIQDNINNTFSASRSWTQFWNRNRCSNCNGCRWTWTSHSPSTTKCLNEMGEERSKDSDRLHLIQDLNNHTQEINVPISSHQRHENSELILFEKANFVRSVISKVKCLRSSNSLKRKRKSSGKWTSTSSITCQGRNTRDSEW